ncbi:MAG: ATP-binding protein [Anaerolineales bacterium]|jgi:MinD superfamily P-loop ATPase|nr:ATP-binding protein [Anaerolineales bacterium]
MKQLVILSGKGGTGKTSLAAAFAHLAHTGPFALQAVLADADVDAANLGLVLRPQRLETHDFTGGSVAVIDTIRCQGCGICEQVCRFDAVIPPTGTQPAYTVDAIACDGCAACVNQCPEEAIHMQPQTAGRWHRSESRYGPLFHADLYPAQENSGKLVTLVKQNARLLALDTHSQLVIVDGPPGIGCPVIAAASGADLAVIVTEPTLAGVHDLKRILQTTTHFRIPTLVVINKADIYPQGADEIDAICAELGIERIGSIPFDPTVTAAMLNGEPVTAYQADAASSQALVNIWKKVAAHLNEGGGWHD